MPDLILKFLYCEGTVVIEPRHRLRLVIRSDGNSTIKEKTIGREDTWLLDDETAFDHRVRLELLVLNVFGQDILLGELEIGPESVHRAIGRFSRGGWKYKYQLWYEVVDSSTGHAITELSLRQMLGRLGRGVLAEGVHRRLMHKAIYQCSEVISLRDTFRFHRAQDGTKGDTNSVRAWINRHCNQWGSESIIPVNETPLAEGESKWQPVAGESSRVVAGLQLYSKLNSGDDIKDHETLDWNWDQLPDPAFTYLLNYTAIRLKLNEEPDRKILAQLIHNELESGSFPRQWRPFPGEYVTTWGRHVFDVDHLPAKVEVHPAHTIIREHTTAAPIGDDGTWVPVNRAIIGMGLSGGFPCGTRWPLEFGEKPEQIHGDTADCWATNLKRHPLRFKFFPPVPRPSSTANLRSRIVLSEIIRAQSWSTVDEFLELCQETDPAEDGAGLGFRVWDRGRGLPSGFTPEAAPAELLPTFTLRRDAYFDVSVDLDEMDGIPLGYYAIIECGWSEKARDTRIFQFDVTFEEFEAVQTAETYDDWYIFYGVNGKWAAWYTDDRIEEGEMYRPLASVFRVWTIDDMPLAIRECGIEAGGPELTVISEDRFLDRMEITLPGPDHFAAIDDSDVFTAVLSPEGNELRLKVKGWKQGGVEYFENEGKTKHEWTLSIVRSEIG
jgi:hypothetical protein